jgi:NADPH:quinone reductase-like Zn-dependent oxidoreductase
MRALRFSHHGPPDVLAVVEIPVPTPGPGEVLVRVRAASVNPVDVGLVAVPIPFVPDLRLPAVPGWDVAGTVAMIGPETNGFTVGDDVFGLSRFPRLTTGTFAEFTTVPAADLTRKPAELSWEQAGALPLVSLTALQAFAAVGGITPGTRVLIEAAAGGVGHVAVQIAKAAGATVIGTASSPRHEFLREIGVDEPIDYTTTDDVFAAATAANAATAPNAATAGAAAPVHGALISSTAATAKRAAATIEPGGFLVSIQPDITPDIAAIADDRGVRHADILVAADGAGMRHIADLASTGQLRATVAGTYPLDRGAEAFEQVQRRHTTGKVVLLPG